MLHIPDSRAINCIAWGIAISRIYSAKIRHHKRGAFYNTTRGKLVYQVRDRMIESLALPILDAIKRTIGGDR